jgi:SAM-dependent methyltransferase
VVGADVSLDQLAAARARVGDRARLVHADAHALPFADGEFDAVVSILTHTDFDDAAGVLAEVSRVLGAGGVFVLLGVHPCFGSPFIDPSDPRAPRYREAGWRRLPADPGSTKVRARVGVNHLPLADLLNAVVRSGLGLTRVEEPGDDDPPLFLMLEATK